MADISTSDIVPERTRRVEKKNIEESCTAVVCFDGETPHPIWLSPACIIVVDDLALKSYFPLMPHLSALTSLILTGRQLNSQAQQQAPSHSTHKSFEKRHVRHKRQVVGLLPLR